MIDPVFVTIAVIAVLVVGLSKAGLLGGLGVVGVPLLTLVMAPREAAGMMLPVLLCMDAVAIWMYRKECDWSLIRIMLPGAAGVPAVARLSSMDMRFFLLAVMAVPKSVE